MNFSKRISREEHARTITNYSQRQHIAVWYKVSLCFPVIAPNDITSNGPCQNPYETRVAGVSGEDRKQNHSLGAGSSPCIFILLGLELRDPQRALNCHQCAGIAHALLSFHFLIDDLKKGEHCLLLCSSFGHAEADSLSFHHKQFLQHWE